MSKMIFINLPVADLPRSKAFYEAVGAPNNPQFTDDIGACMVFYDITHVMLLSHDKWRGFTSKKMPDAHDSAQVMLALSSDTKEGVSELMEKAVAAGGTSDPTPTQDFDFMFGRSFEDPDSHIWEVFWMDMSAVPADMANAR